MISVWSGCGLSPSTSVSVYQFVTGVKGTPFQSGSNNFNSYACMIPLSDNIIVTGVTAYVATAPGTSASWTVALQTVTGVTIEGTGTPSSTAAAAVISGTNTTASWSGSVSLSQSTFITMQVTPTGTPAATADIHWVITYKTAGNFYLVPSMQLQGFGGGSGTWYQPLFGQCNIAPAGGGIANAVPAPSAFTVTKILAWSAAQGGMPNPKTTSLYNATTLTVSSFGSTTGSPTTTTYLGNVGTGSFSYAAGDLVAVQVSGAGFFGDAWCTTVVPSVPGEIANALTSQYSPVYNSTSFDGVQGAGQNVNYWGYTEPVVMNYMPACKVKNLNVVLPTAPGAGYGYSFVLKTAPAASPSIYLDNANRANDATGMGPDWSANKAVGVGPGIQVVSNSWGITYGNVWHVHVNNVAAPPTNRYDVSIRVSVAGAIYRIYANPYVYVEYNSGGFQIYTATTYLGTATARATFAAGNLIANDTFGLRSDNNVYTVIKNGMPTKVTWTDTGGTVAGSQPHTVGVGMYSGSTGYLFDDFSVDTVATTLGVTISDTATSATNTSAVKAIPVGGTMDVQASVIGTTATVTNGVRMSYTQVIDQGNTTQFLTMF